MICSVMIARAKANPSPGVLDRPPRVEAVLVPVVVDRDLGRGRRSLEAKANPGVNLEAALMPRDHEAGEVPLDPDLDLGIPIEDHRPVGQRKTRGRSLSSKGRSLVAMIDRYKLLYLQAAAASWTFSTMFG